MQNVESSAGSWGGARKGAGRKKMEKGKHYGFNSTPDVELAEESNLHFLQIANSGYQSA